MAGYRNSILKHKPSCFMTFDGDSFFDSEGYLRYPYLHDESGNDNGGYMVTSTAPVKSYSLGMQSLVPRQSGVDQYSICYAPRSHDTNMPFPYDRSVTEIMHTETLNMKDEFTIMFLFQKTNNDNFFAGARYNISKNIYETQSGTTKNFIRTIFRKGLTVGCQWEYYWAQPQYLKFIFPDNNYSWQVPSAEFYGRTYHITMTRKKKKIGTSLFQTIDTVYIDGIIVYTKESNITSETSTAYSTSSIFIGGNLDSMDLVTLNDRQTSPLFVDNFAVFSEKCLTADEIANLYKKVFIYSEYTKRWNPSLYVQFNDQPRPPNTTSHEGTIDVGGTNNKLIYYGTPAQIETGVNGPIRLMGAKATLFKANGMARIASSTVSETVINPSGDYTLEFFAKFTSNTRGVIFSCQSNNYPYKGILVEANMRENDYYQGGIQVSLERDLYISTKAVDSQGNPIRYNDNKYHLYTIIRRGNKFEFWLDGTLIESKYGNTGSMISSAGTIYLMGMMPNKLSTTGEMSQMAFYPYAMQSHNIRAKAFFYTRMRIKGRISLQGVPHAATLRVMNHTSAALLVEGMSDGNTGQYDIDVYSDDFIDVLVMDKKDTNVRYRAFGPLLAGEYTDIDDETLE